LIEGDEALGGGPQVYTWSWVHTNYPQNDTSQSTIKGPLVILENAPQIPLFNTPKLHFE